MMKRRWNNDISDLQGRSLMLLTIFITVCIFFSLYHRGLIQFSIQFYLHSTSSQQDPIILERKPQQSDNDL